MPTVFSQTFFTEGFLPCVVAVVRKHRLFRSALELPMIDGHKDWVLHTVHDQLLLMKCS
jgi:hypothetical protein